MNPSVNRYRKPKNKIIIPDRVAKRAATKYIEDEDGCWISTYSVASHGYAQIGWQDSGYRQVVTAHRAAWVHFTGEQISEGMTIDHTCKNKPCINPGHLRMTTNFENARRTQGRDWKMGECVNGHSNDHLYWNGSRYHCRPCTQAARRRYEERNPGRLEEARRRYKERHPERVAESKRRHAEKKRQKRAT